MLGTRFMATPEAPIHANFKQAIVNSDGHDTVLTEIPDLASQRVWPGAMSRAQRNQFIERWAGREWMVRQNAREIGQQLAAARAAGDINNASLSFGQDAGLIRFDQECQGSCPSHSIGGGGNHKNPSALSIAVVAAVQTVSPGV